MTDKIVMVEKLRSMVIKPSRIDYETYFKAKELLKIYKDVLWNIEEGIEELDKQSRELLGEDLAFAVEILDKFDYRMNKEKLDDKLLDASEIKIMVELIAHALIKVKNYPLTVNDTLIFYNLIFF